ncbi:class I SAM-dependent methyltransferase [Paenibacillus macerans]|uniref:class I SAM-dependent methyltransferase n=1 Tax=Paenibacillus macerans TaxID=44252 RepID=UPI003D317CF5
MRNYGEDLFKDTAWYYSRYRPLYPSSLIRYLVHKFSLNGEGRLLDLGCGTGQFTLRFADWFHEITGIDAEPEMLDEAKRLSLENRVENIKWLCGKAEDSVQALAPIRLTVIAKAFHWMDRDAVLQILYNNTDENGGIAIIDPYHEEQEALSWQLKINDVLKRWLGPERRAGNGIYIPPQEKYEDIVARSNFKYVEKHALPDDSYTWTVDSIIGNLYSTSYASKRFFNHNHEQFEEELKAALLEVDATGVFSEKISISVVTAFK